MFQSPDLVGLLIMHPDLRTAFRQIGPVVSAIIAAEYGIDEEYGPEMDFEAFSRSLESEQVSDGIAVYRHAA
ncbi:MAG: hypothetical protein LDL56_12335 [Armatimonadetes bacterium]|nr:hypothetical protein [Armatimonadota bacterium]